jgi:hypothetical protein
MACAPDRFTGHVVGERGDELADAGTRLVQGVEGLDPQDLLLEGLDGFSTQRLVSGS